MAGNFGCLPYIFTGVRSMPDSPSKIKWIKEHTTSIGLKLNNRTDRDILDAREGKQKQTEIKRLVRKGLEHDHSHWTKAAPGSMPEDLQRVIATVEYSDGYRETLANCRWNKSLNRWEWESNAGTATWGSLIGTVTHWMCMPTPADD